MNLRNDKQDLVKKEECKVKRIPVFEEKFLPTPIYQCNGFYGENELYIKRDDLLPFSFGGNKVRKAQKFYKEIMEQEPTVLVTYGSSSSNHCRIIANMATALGIACHIISPKENSHETTNSKIVSSLGAKVTYCELNRVKETIDETLEKLSQTGKPYFIMGGGHGNPGTEGYVDAYEEIAQYEQGADMEFDYIFHASGTGATQAGLVAGQLLNGRCGQKIVGISIARPEASGGKVVLDSVCEYLEHIAETGRLSKETKEILKQKAAKELCFTDKYRLDGYGCYNEAIEETITKVEKQEGIAMDTTYVGKAFWGMTQFLQDNDIRGKKILFVHTGGTPLYFNQL